MTPVPSDRAWVEAAVDAGLLALAAVAILGLLTYYATNRVIRRQVERAAAVSLRVEVGVSTALFAFIMPLAVALGLTPIVALALTRPAVVPFGEDLLYLLGITAGAMVGLAGAGMHAAGRSIDAQANGALPPRLRAMIDLYHGPLGHHPLHVAWAVVAAACALLCAAHPSPASAVGAPALATAGAVTGVIRAISVLEGRSWRVSLPAELVLCAVAGWRLHQLGIPPTASYFAASLVAGVLFLLGWGALHRGFPRTCAPRVQPLQMRAAPPWWPAGGSWAERPPAAGGQAPD
jgi:hypothetical protein